MADFLIPHSDGEDAEAMLIEINPFGPGTGASLFDWRTERRLLQANHDLWADLNTTCAQENEQSDSWKKTTACRVDKDLIYVRLAARPHPEIDSTFLSSFGIDILLPTTNEDDEDESDEEDEDEDEQDDESEVIDEFLDEFVTDLRLRPIVHDKCQSQFAKRWTSTFVEAVVGAIKTDEQVCAWLQARGIAWSEPLEKAVAKGAKQWYAYCIATRA